MADDETPSLQGSCLCGGVRYAARGPFTAVARCHCVQCRKASGAEFATNASLTRDRFELLEGGDLVKAYLSSPGNQRHFCGRCGSPVFKTFDDQPEIVRLRLGLLDDPFTDPVQVRVFTDQKLPMSVVPEDGEPSFGTAPGR